MKMCPALQAVQALSKQPTQQHHQGRSLIKCKTSNGCEVCQVCRYLSQSFFFFFFLSLQHGKGVNGKFGKFPPVCPPEGFGSEKLHASPDLASCVTSLAS